MGHPQYIRIDLDCIGIQEVQYLNEYSKLSNKSCPWYVVENVHTRAFEIVSNVCQYPII
jgi:hypothetical protein